MKNDLSIVILCYRSGIYAERYLAMVLDSLKINDVSDYEIILVANYVEGTADKTPEIVRNLAKDCPGVSFLAQRKEGWLGWDVRKAFEIAKGNYVALIDGDGQMPADDIPRAFKEIKEGELDLVLTYRVKRGDGLYRQILSLLYNLAVKLLFPSVQSKDINSKPKVIKKCLLDSMNLKSNGWTIDAEIMLQSYKRKARIKEIPTNFLGQGGKRKSFVGFKAILEFLYFLVKQRLKGVK
jgi:glycosyltransferase involved in cell wall biosynthesis